MQRVKMSLIAAVFFAAFAVSAIKYAASADAVKESNRFAGKYVTLYLKGPTMDFGHRLKDVKIEEVEGVKMLAGIGISSDDDYWTEDVETYVPYDTIATIFAMTPEQYEAAERKSKSEND